VNLQGSVVRDPGSVCFAGFRLLAAGYWVSRLAVRGCFTIRGFKDQGFNDQGFNDQGFAISDQ
jgi:non-ribosomal peptide synthetase component E (peptide arylation enzyme)